MNPLHCMFVFCQMPFSFAPIQSIGFSIFFFFAFAKNSFFECFPIASTVHMAISKEYLLMFLIQQFENFDCFGLI